MHSYILEIKWEWAHLLTSHQHQKLLVIKTTIVCENGCEACDKLCKINDIHAKTASKMFRTVRNSRLVTRNDEDGEDRTNYRLTEEGQDMRVLFRPGRSFSSVLLRYR